MSEAVELSVREVRNNISEVLRRVRAGEHFRVTVDRRPVAQLIPLPVKRESISGAEFLAWYRRTGGADPGLADELTEIVGETVGDLEIK